MKALNKFVLIELLEEEIQKIGLIDIPSGKKPLRKAKVLSVSDNLENKNIVENSIVLVNNSVCEFAYNEEKGQYFVNENALFGIE